METDSDVWVYRSFGCAQDDSVEDEIAGLAGNDVGGGNEVGRWRSDDSGKDWL